MAKNTNHRIPVKWIRDRAKSAYEKQSNCFVCGVETDLELHHTHSITLLLNNWVAANHLDISTDSKVLEIRDEFIEAHHDEIYRHVYTLCNRHHVQLHSVYGKAPALHTASRQSVWLDHQKARWQGGEREILTSANNVFSEFYLPQSFKDFIGAPNALV